MEVKLQAKTIEEIFYEIEKKLDEKTEKVHLSMRPSTTVLVHILSKAPNIKVIAIPPSLHKSVPSKIKRALEKVGVDLVAERRTPGRPKRRDPKPVIELLKKGYSARQISKRLGIPVSTVYYYRNKFSTAEV